MDRVAFFSLKKYRKYMRRSNKSLKVKKIGTNQSLIKIKGKEL